MLTAEEKNGIFLTELGHDKMRDILGHSQTTRQLEI